MKINKNYVSENNTSTLSELKYVVIHNTDNFNSGATAKAHASAQCAGHFQGMSAHFYVDDSKDNIVYQAARLERGTWHVGVNYGQNNLFSRVKNHNSIGIETCVQSGYSFNRSMKNLIQFVRFLMEKENISHENVFSHKDVCSKNCPSQILAKNKWNYFKEKIKKPFFLKGSKYVLIEDIGLRNLDESYVRYKNIPLLSRKKFVKVGTKCRLKKGNIVKCLDVLKKSNGDVWIKIKNGYLPVKVSGDLRIYVK